MLVLGVVRLRHVVRQGRRSNLDPPRASSLFHSLHKKGIFPQIREDFEFQIRNGPERNTFPRLLLENPSGSSYLNPVLLQKLGDENFGKFWVRILSVGDFGGWKILKKINFS